MFTWPTIVKKPKAKRVLVLAPHMDDEIIGCGGVIAKHTQNGDHVAVVYFTCGDKGTKDFSSDGSLSLLRKEEIRRANEILGIKNAYFLDFEDGTAEDWSPKKEVLRGIYLQEAPELVYLPPYFDLHLDHRKTNLLFQKAMEGLSPCDLCIYEVWTPINPNIIVNITAQMEQKLRAISACETQLRSVDYISFIRNLNAYRSAFAMSPLVHYSECFYRLSGEEYFAKFSEHAFDWHSANKK